MAARPEAEGSEEQGELAPADLRAMAALSKETVQLISDEAPSSGPFSSSPGRQSGPQDSGSRSPAGKSTSCLEYQEKQSERSEEKFSWKRINYLKGKETTSGKHQADAKLQTEITGVSDEQSNALQSFCTSKINLILRRANSKGRESRSHKNLPLRLDAAVPSEVDTLNCTVPDELLNRIWFKNVTATLKQAATVEQHITSRCPHCNRKKAELAQSAFLKRKKTLLESLLLQERLDEHLHTTDIVTLIGEAHKGLPRLSDDPRMIWKRLHENSQKRHSGLERSDTEKKMYQNGNSPLAPSLHKPPTPAKQEMLFINDNV